MTAIHVAWTAMRRCRFVVVVLAMVLAGCASVTTTESAIVTNDLPVAYFSLVGRLSVRVDNRLDVGNVRWSRTANEERFGIYTPFGGQVAEMVKTAEGVVLRKGNEERRAQSVGELTADLLGVSLDIDAVARWVQGAGLIAERASDVTLPDGGVWQVTASALKESEGRVHASRLSAIKGDVVVKLVVDEWRPQ